MGRAAHQTVESVVRNQRNRCDADKFRFSQMVGLGKEFVTIWINVGFCSVLSPR